MVGETEVSVVFVEVGNLPCFAGFLMIFPVVGMAGFFASATLEDPLVAVLARGRSVMYPCCLQLMISLTLSLKALLLMQ